MASPTKQQIKDVYLSVAKYYIDVLEHTSAHLEGPIHSVEAQEIADYISESGFTTEVIPNDKTYDIYVMK